MADQKQDALAAALHDVHGGGPCFTRYRNCDQNAVAILAALTASGWTLVPVEHHSTGRVSEDNPATGPTSVGTRAVSPHPAQPLVVPCVFTLTTDPFLCQVHRGYRPRLDVTKCGVWMQRNEPAPAPLREASLAYSILLRYVNRPFGPPEARECLDALRAALAAPARPDVLP